MRETDDGLETYHRGQQLCGLVWTCPYCGPHIRRKRAEEIDEACTVWQEKYGVGSMMLLTLTVPHDAGDTLKRTLEVVRDCNRKLFSGRRWQSIKAHYHLAFKISAHDCTCGEHGWHPHLHIILFCTVARRRAGGRCDKRDGFPVAGRPGRRAGGGLGAVAVDQLAAEFHQAWADLVEMRGLRRPSREHGTDLRRARDVRDLGRYVAKLVGQVDAHAMGSELARSDLKAGKRAGHRTPWEILADFVETGDAGDLELWHEWEQETRGVQAIRWSRGLRQLVALAQAERSDQQLVDAVAADAGVMLVRYSFEQWRAIRDTPDAEERVLELGRLYGAEAVIQFVDSLTPKEIKSERPATHAPRNLDGVAANL